MLEKWVSVIARLPYLCGIFVTSVIVSGAIQQSWKLSQYLFCILHAKVTRHDTRNYFFWPGFRQRTNREQRTRDPTPNRSILSR